MIFVGKDSYNTLHYIDLPKLFKPYDDDLDEAIESFINSPFNDSSHNLLINNMIARNVLHLFIEKHIKVFFEEYGPNKGLLEFHIKKEASRLFNCKINDIGFNIAYENYRKGNSIKSLALEYLNEKLINYQNRLDAVEL